MPLLIKQYLKAHSITMNDLAERMGKSQPAVSLQVNGNPAFSSLEEIAQALGCEVADLISVRDGYVHWTEHDDHTALLNRIKQLEQQVTELTAERDALSVISKGEQPRLYHCPNCQMQMQVVKVPE